LLVVAMAPMAWATCSANSSKLKGTYAFRLDPATSFATNLASAGDPAGVLAAVTPPNKQNVMQAGEFTANGACQITAGDTYAVLDDEYGSTALVDFTWAGTYSVNSTDYTGSLAVSPDPLNGNTG